MFLVQSLGLIAEHPPQHYRQVFWVLPVRIVDPFDHRVPFVRQWGITSDVHAPENRVADAIEVLAIDFAT